ncbi:MAG: hypothetical protein NT075_05235, partial [Chloroflexi bacterium]|nr:hypothetical protein [Chloroflexota bacterium]
MASENTSTKVPGSPMIDRPVAHRPTPRGVNQKPKIANRFSHTGVLVAYLLLTAIMTWPLVRNLTTAIPGDSFDGWQNYWNLWWIKTALVEQIHNPYMTNALFYPTGVNLYFHTLNPFNGLLTLPIQLSTDLIPAYNAVVFFSWIMGGYGVYLLTLWVLGKNAEDSPQHHDEQDRLAKIGQQKSAAFLAGLIFTFSPFHMAHLLGHMQVMSLEWLPFYILYLLRALAASRRQQAWVRSALLAGLFLILTGLCDWYFVLYLFFFTVIAIGWHWLPLRNQEVSPQAPQTSPPLTTAHRLISALRPALVAGALFVLVLAPLLLPMLREATEFSFMVRPSSDLYIFSASLMDFFVPNRLHPFFLPASLTWIGNQVAPPSEHTISIGYTALALTLVAAWKIRRQSAFWLMSAVFFLLLALGPHMHLGNITQTDIPSAGTASVEWTPYAVLNQVVPFMRISRSVSRYALMVELSLAITAGLGLAALLRHRRPVVGLILALLSAVLVLGEFWVAPFPLSPPDTPAFYTQLRDLPDTGAVLNLPMNYDRPGYLLYQTVHQKPLTVGYISRDDPRTLTERAPVLQHFRHLGPDILDIDPALIGMTVLHDLGVSFVVEDRYKMPGGEERSYTEGLASAIFAGQPAFFADDRLTVQRVYTPDKPMPYVVLGEFNWGPLHTDKRCQRSRGITKQPASLYFYHLTENTQ